VEVTERRAWSINGFLPLFGAFVLVAAAVWQFVLMLAGSSAGRVDVSAIVSCSVLAVLALLLVAPLVVIQPGEARVVQFFGRYIGTARRTGLVWVVPFASTKRVSVRVHNFETNALKVNDADGNPIEVAAIVVWQVADTARASFAVEDYQSFVAVQAEAAVRHVATTHPYDEYSEDDGTEAATSLRGSTDVVSEELAHEVAERVAVAGVEIVEVRISHLAYAPEIAQAMLQRQQAGAVVAAREQIVEGAVGMVEMALNRLRDDDVVDLDEERKAAMVSNLLVVLCGDQRATPVVNTGSLYT
jgi:regulator of protease activity HflC (stomatin/prohibitin superfamily)